MKKIPVDPTSVKLAKYVLADYYYLPQDEETIMSLAETIQHAVDEWLYWTEMGLEADRYYLDKS